MKPSLGDTEVCQMSHARRREPQARSRRRDWGRVGKLSAVAVSPQTSRNQIMSNYWRLYTSVLTSHQS
jgi:hypothetical protein